MKRKLRWLLLLVPLALFAWAYQAASWRPKLIGTQPIFSGGGQRPLPYGPGAWLLISPDGKRLVSSGVDLKSSFVMGWDIAARKARWRTNADFSISGMGALAFSPDSRTLAVSVDEGSFGRSNFVIDFVETATGKRRRFMRISWQTRLQDAAFLSDRALVVSTSEGVSIVDTQTGVIKRHWKLKLPAPPNQQLFAPGEIRISADGTTILASSERTSNTVVALYDSVTGGQRGKWFCPGISRHPRLSPDGTLWAMETGRLDMMQSQTLKSGAFVDVYDSRTGKKLWSRIVAGDGASAWAWRADSKRIMAVWNEVQNLDARTGRVIGQIAVNDNVQNLGLDPNGDYFYTLDTQGKIWRWRLR